MKSFISIVAIVIFAGVAEAATSCTHQLFEVTSSDNTGITLKLMSSWDKIAAPQGPLVLSLGAFVYRMIPRPNAISVEVTSPDGNRTYAESVDSKRELLVVAPASGSAHSTMLKVFCE